MRQTLFILFLLVSNKITAQYTSIPDINFEKALISLGIDNGSTDGKILTSSISFLTTLSIGGRNISDLTGIEDFINLTELRCQANNLTTLDLSKNLNLVILRCQTNQLTNLNVTKNLNLKDLWCDENKLTSVDFSKNINLETLVISRNQITNIDVSKNIKLDDLLMSFNQIDNLDISNNINLTNLQCSNNNIKKLDLSKNLLMKYLWCYDNELTSLDISKNRYILYLNCSDNKLTSLNLKNGNNFSFDTRFHTYCDFKLNPNLNCILVDNLTYSNTNWQSLKDANTSYSEILDVAPTIFSPQSFCEKENKTLNNIIITTGQNIKWYDALTNGNNLLETVFLENGKTYYASQNINGCESERVAILINIQNILPPTAVSNQSFCTGTNPTIANIQVTGNSIKWYDALNNGTLLTETTNLENGKTYFASQTVNNCESERFGITVSIVNTPAIPTVNATQSFCKNENATLDNIEMSGQNIKWYDTNFSAAALPNTTLLENKTYYASQTIGCESDRTAVLVRVYNTPLPIANQNQQFCIDENTIIADLTIIGSNIKWYDQSTNGIVLAETTLLQDGKTYYATQTANDCESQRLAITVNIQNTPIPVVNSQQIFCIQKKAKISDIIIDGQNINWFESISASTTLAESTLLENSMNYYVSQTINNCESNRIPISINILEATTADCINFIDELPFPKFFTPNNDGYNDNWTINFAYLKPSTVIKIFDQYGKLLKIVVQNESWNGQFNNQELPATDYWFTVIRANGQEYKGHFTLKR